MAIKHRLITCLVGFHLLMIGIWSLLGMRLNAIEDNVHYEQLPPVLISILANYVAITGSEQYWDFFAPAAYNDYLALIVCDQIRVMNDHIECTGNVLYQSYDGDWRQVFKKFDGQRSRSYRFVEQLIKQDDADLQERFLRYWSDHSPNTDSENIYLIGQTIGRSPQGGKVVYRNRLLSAWVRS